MSPLNTCLEIQDKADRFEMFEGFNSREILHWWFEMEAAVLQGPEECPLVSETDLWLIASKKTSSPTITRN